MLKFLKTYFVFLACSLATNLTLEAIFTPESFESRGIVIFYILFSIIGAIILLKKRYGARKMGIWALVLGFIFEFSFMRPDWVLNVCALEIDAGTAIAVVVSALYWFIAWAIPSLVIHKFFEKSSGV